MSQPMTPSTNYPFPSWGGFLPHFLKSFLTYYFQDRNFVMAKVLKRVEHPRELPRVHPMSTVVHEKRIIHLYYLKVHTPDGSFEIGVSKVFYDLTLETQAVPIWYIVDANSGKIRGGLLR